MLPSPKRWDRSIARAIEVLQREHSVELITECYNAVHDLVAITYDPTIDAQSGILNIYGPDELARNHRQHRQNQRQRDFDHSLRRKMDAPHLPGRLLIITYVLVFSALHSSQSISFSLSTDVFHSHFLFFCYLLLGTCWHPRKAFSTRSTLWITVLRIQPWWARSCTSWRFVSVFCHFLRSVFLPQSLHCYALPSPILVVSSRRSVPLPSATSTLLAGLECNLRSSSRINRAGRTTSLSTSFNTRIPRSHDAM